MCRVEAFLPNNKKRHASPNLTAIQQHLLDVLENSATHIVISADKNLGPVIIERDKYIAAVLSLLQDEKTYKRLSKEEAKDDMGALKALVTDWITKYDLYGLDNDESEYLLRYLATVKDPYSHFYITAKIHKKPWKLRPIVSYCGSYLYGLGKWIDTQLQPIAKTIPSYISSSFNLCDELKEIRINPSRDKLFTADANSMYTNIDTNHALEVFREFFKKHELCRPIWHRADMILEALEIPMRHNIFKFGDTFWRQEDGTAMGAPPAPAYATLYYAIHELYLIEKFGRFLPFYRRYIDDALAVWRSSNNKYEDRHYWKEFKKAMDNFGILTWKVEDRRDSVDFYGYHNLH